MAFLTKLLGLLGLLAFFCLFGGCVTTNTEGS
jgi:hypothetical protein